MKQKRFYSYALATSLLISSFGGLVNVSAATYQDAEEVKAQEHVSIMKMDASASDLFKFSTKSQRASNCASVSAGYPTIKVVRKVISGIRERSREIMSINSSYDPLRFIVFKIVGSQC